jgi:hypothetical protein
MTSETSPLENDSVHADHHDSSELIVEFRQRQLSLFRERQIDLASDDAM